ncbi:MAG: YlzJ-like family protein [Peptococcaceae bacterium]|nr:YlzJ-like family protein [Peptococcaceae bacterium]
MLYTIVPEEYIFAVSDDVGHFQEVAYLGRQVLVQPVDQRRCQIVQLLSNDPSDFLVTALSPGNIIAFP